MAKPTAEDQQWHAAAEQLSPQKSLERTQTLAGFVFANVAVVGTLLTGLGAAVDGGVVLRESPHFIGVPLPILFVGVSLLAASLAMFPKLGRVNPARPDEVKSWYSGQILRRGIAAIVSLTAFSAAIVAAIASFGSRSLSDVQISASRTGNGSGASLAVSVKVTRAPRKARALTTVNGTTRRGAPRHLLFARTRADASGALAVDASLNHMGRYTRLVVHSRVFDGDDKLADKRLVIRVPRR